MTDDGCVDVPPNTAAAVPTGAQREQAPVIVQCSPVEASLGSHGPAPSLAVTICGTVGCACTGVDWATCTIVPKANRRHRTVRAQRQRAVLFPDLSMPLPCCISLGQLSAMIEPQQMIRYL